MKNKLREMRNNKKGFTLIEMIVVIVIIAILVALAVPAVMGYVSDAREAKLKAAASAGVTTMQVAMAKSESLGELATKYQEIKEKGEAAAGADTTIVACTVEMTSGQCATDKVFDGTKGSLDDIKTYIVSIGKTGSQDVVYFPASGGEALVNPEAEGAE